MARTRTLPGRLRNLTSVLPPKTYAPSNNPKGGCLRTEQSGYAVQWRLIKRTRLIPREPEISVLSTEIVSCCIGNSKVRSAGMGIPYAHNGAVHPALDFRPSACDGAQLNHTYEHVQR